LSYSIFKSIRSNLIANYTLKLYDIVNPNPIVELYLVPRLFLGFREGWVEHIRYIYQIYSKKYRPKKIYFYYKITDRASKGSSQRRVFRRATTYWLHGSSYMRCYRKIYLSILSS